MIGTRSPIIGIHEEPKKDGNPSIFPQNAVTIIFISLIWLAFEKLE